MVFQPVYSPHLPALYPERCANPKGGCTRHYTLFSVPHNVGRPSREELNLYASAICSEFDVRMRDSEIAQLVDFHQCDMRRVVHALQWSSASNAAADQVSQAPVVARGTPKAKSSPKRGPRRTAKGAKAAAAPNDAVVDEPPATIGETTREITMESSLGLRGVCGGRSFAEVLLHGSSSPSEVSGERGGEGGDEGGVAAMRGCLSAGLLQLRLHAVSFAGEAFGALPLLDHPLRLLDGALQGALLGPEVRPTHTFVDYSPTTIQALQTTHQPRNINHKP